MISHADVKGTRDMTRECTYQAGDACGAYLLLMKAHLIQFDIRWEDKTANYARVREMVSKADVRTGDFVILPELFDTGFSFNIEATADADGCTLEFLCDLAKTSGCFVQGTRTVQQAATAKAKNRATIVSPGGDVVIEYEKIHPFSFGREPERFDGGDRVVTYAWGRGEGALTVCPAICYDLRFPELFRLGLMQGAEVYAISTNWPDTRHMHWRALLVARAIENQAVVLGVNRTGRDPHLNFVGGSLAVGPKGEILGELGAEEAVLSVEVDPSAIRGWRAQFPAWRDARLAGLTDPTKFRLERATSH